MGAISLSIKPKCPPATGSPVLPSGFSLRVAQDLSPPPRSNCSPGKQGERGPVGRAGPRGDAGPPGAPGIPLGVELFQVVPAAFWSFTHALGRKPNVTLYDTSGEEIISDVLATDTTVTVLFATPIAGSAVLN